MPTLENKFQVAIFDEFLDSFAKLPRAQQRKVNRFISKFRSDPTNASLNYEKISTFVDPNLRTVRIDQAYRAIVLKPEKGNVYVLLWVDHHDEAMEWARNKRCAIHPETGTLQVLTAGAVEPAVEEVPKPKGRQPKPLFEAFTDEQLESVGVPPESLEYVREIRSAEQLDQAGQKLPPDPYLALLCLLDGDDIETVQRELGIEPLPEVDTEDFEAALENPSTKARFKVVTDDQDLQAMLDAPLEKWRVFLHPSQRKLVRATFKGPARVLGGAGTGKTVVAMHRACYLASEVFQGENDRLLFTTFTHNLARDIHENLKKICDVSALARIEVVHLDRWVANTLKSQGYDYRIVYWPDPKLEALWEQALVDAPDDFTHQFFREEWDYVVQPEGCSSFEDYKKARRAGRGVRLSRQQRKELWKVFETYRSLLESRGLRESVDAMADAAALLERRKGPSPYKAVIIDEAQDMSTIAFRLLRAIIPAEQENDLFIVGDGHQRIYRAKVVLKQAGVNIVGRSRKLYLNYRTTDEIRRYAVALLNDVSIDDLDEGSDDNKRYRSLAHGQPPLVKVFPNFAEEVKGILEYVRQDEASHTCLVARTNDLVDQYEAALNDAGLETCRVKRSQPEDRSRQGLRLATMHRVKGLEFDRLVIAGVNDGVVPLQRGEYRETTDGAVREELEKRERALFYVALTRARREVLVTAGGVPAEWLRT